VGQKSPEKRRRHAVTSQVYKPYVIAIGQLALAWNELHESLALLFIELLANGRAYPATDIWNAATFDRPKRQLIKSLLRTANLKYPAKPLLKTDLEWLLAQTDKVEDARNDAVHAPLTFTSEGAALSILTSGGNKKVPVTITVNRVVPSTAFDNRRAMKLLNKDLLTEFRWCRDMSLSLTEYVGEVYEAIAANPPGSDAWPTRPALPSRGIKKKGKATK
jgi:hypothetical protein